MEEKIKGVIHKVFAKSDNWSSVLLSLDGGNKIICKGNIICAVEGVELSLTGEYVVDLRYGKQFSVKCSEIIIGSNAENIYRYLSSGIIIGLGEKTALKIVDYFGVDSLKIIREDYKQLTKIKGISEKKAFLIHKEESKATVFQDLLAYAKLTLSQAFKIYEYYGNKSLEVIKKTPYEIIYNINGFGFKTVDSIALKNGCEKDSKERIAAAINFALNSVSENGHCYCSNEVLEDILNDVLPDVSLEKKVEVLVEQIKDEKVILDDECMYSYQLYKAEDSVARNIISLLKNNKDTFLQKKIDKAIRETEFENGFELEKQQIEAVNTAMRNRVSIITGGPGTGKSTIIKAIAKAWLSQFPAYDEPTDHILLCSPTGKASRRMSEVTGIYAETIQRIIAKHKSKDSPDLQDKMIVIDESSMIDMLLAKDILYLAAQNNNKVVFIGDTNQLPPIGAGNFFRDLIKSPCIPSVELSLCHRQKGKIAKNAKLINDGRGLKSFEYDDTFAFVPAEKNVVRKTILDEYFNLLDFYEPKDVAVIVPMRKAGRSQTSATDLNNIIREKINPFNPSAPCIDSLDLRIGDRIMCTINNYEYDIFNGDCGTITHLDNSENTIFILLDDGRSIEIPSTFASSFTLAYAITTHKAQGSEYKAVVIAQNMEHFIMLQRNLLYTAVTRAKERVVLVGEAKAINYAVRQVSSIERNTKLKQRIMKYAQSKRSL